MQPQELGVGFISFFVKIMEKSCLCLLLSILKAEKYTSGWGNNIKISYIYLKTTRVQTCKCLEKVPACYILNSHCIVWNRKHDVFVSGYIPVWVIAFCLHKLHWQFSLGTVLFFISNLTLLLYTINTQFQCLSQEAATYCKETPTYSEFLFYSSIPHCSPKPVFSIKFRSNYEISNTLP